MSNLLYHKQSKREDGVRVAVATIFLQNGFTHILQLALKLSQYDAKDGTGLSKGPNVDTSRACEHTFEETALLGTKSYERLMSNTG